jgi:hypothetical protein
VKGKAAMSGLFEQAFERVKLLESEAILDPPSGLLHPNQII